VTSATGKAFTGIVAGTERMAVDIDGIHAGPGMTGTPLAYALVGVGGSLAYAKSANVASVTHTATGVYEIAITGETVDYLTHIAVVTPYSSGPTMVSHEMSAGVLVVRTYGSSGTPADRAFCFAIYKP
jgi:hypothetical protein